MQSTENGKEVICIIGMHRSGTSMVARLLNLCGLDLGPPDQLMPPYDGNPLGYFENMDFSYKIDDALLAHFGGSWDSPPNFKEDWEYDPSLERIVEEAKTLVKTFSKSPQWGWKDPRTTILLPFWKSLIPNLKFVICVRSPLEVAKSLARRDRIPTPKGAYLWNFYMRAAIRDTEGCPRIFAFYEDFFKEAPGEINKLIEFCGLQMPDNISGLQDSICRELKHHTCETLTLLNDDKLITEYKLFYLGLRALTTDGFVHPTPDSTREVWISKNISTFFKLLEQFRDEQEMAKLQFTLAGLEVDRDTWKVRSENQEGIIEEKEKNIEDLVNHKDNLEKTIAEKETYVNILLEQINSLKNAIREKDMQLSLLADFEATIKSNLLYKTYRLLTKPVSSSVRKGFPAIHLRQSQNSKPKVLFISHDDFCAGASILLLNFLKWLKANANIPFEILLKDVYGDLRAEFNKLAPVLIWNKPGSVNGSLAGIDHIKAYLCQSNIGLIYSNTITNGKVLAALGLNCPVICHVHELEYWIKYRTEQDNNEQVKKHTHHYIAVSQAVKRNLVENLKIPEEKIDVVYEFVPIKHNDVNQTKEQYRIRKQLKIPHDAQIVGACGTTDWRKGPDLFIQLARTINHRLANKPVHFIWVGGENEGPNFGALWHDVKRTGLEEYVHFVGKQPNPLDYFAVFDVFTMVSREDPFPLVNLEASSLHKPLVCFDGSGGTKELVEDGCGFFVPYLDIEKMADRVVELLESPELRQEIGQRAAGKVREQYSLDVNAPKILNIVERYLQKAHSQ
jgi:glycosyltransferase involved in cell wall biosynthesis